jgi:hypothetical protein
VGWSRTWLEETLDSRKEKRRMKLTIGALKDMIQELPEDLEVQFSGGLEFYRLKRRAADLVQFEFSESVWRDSEGNWHVDAAS